jgi:nicotinate phosphoribosyltransferase
VYRRYDAAGRIAGDVLTLEGDVQEGEPLIEPVMRAGKRLAGPLPLASLRQRALHALARLPDELRGLEQGPEYPVVISRALRDLAKAVDERRF